MDNKTPLYQNQTKTENEILNPEIEALVNAYSQELLSPKKNYTPIHVDEIASKLAKFYEKIRKIIDWKDDNALRRGAIERVLKRIVFPKLNRISSLEAKKIAETVTMELIRGGHLPNDTIPKEKLSILSKAIEKYLYFLEYASGHFKPTEIKDKTNFNDLIMEIAACEIEEILANPIKEYSIITAAAESLNRRISILPAKAISPEEKRKQSYIAAARAIYGLDDKFLIYQLLKKQYQNWQQPSQEERAIIAQELPETFKKLDQEINQPIGKKFSLIAERVDTVFILLDDVLEMLKDQPKEITQTLKDKTKFTKLVSRAYEKRSQTLKTRLLHSAIFSTLSVFLSNWFTFFVVEVPLARLFYQGFSLTAAIVDFLVPAAVMFLLVIIIRPPKEDNFKKAISTTLSFVYQDEKQEQYQIQVDQKQFSFSKTIITIIYSLSAILSFAGIAYIFYIAKLPTTSIILDTFTIALTVFAAMAIKNKSKELSVDEHVNIQDFLLDAVTVPMAKVGSILARKWREYNLIATFFNFMIETPFALVLDFIQDWSEYIKEKRAELH
ncbi:MAG: hypothetical protein XD98_0532 [Microgenomates bacterium 39_6]|nr:MAG: hypothetical protein XD98_0532 [Microgenomates bacterium 39_6]